MVFFKHFPGFPVWKQAVSFIVLFMALLVVGYGIFSDRTEDDSNGFVKLGLDLKGGSHLVLEADLDVFLQEQSDLVANDLALVIENLDVNYYGFHNIGSDIYFNILKLTDFDLIKDAINGYGDYLSVNIDNNIVHVAVEQGFFSEKLIDVIDRSISVIRKRVDQLGTNEPTIVRQGSEQIIVQLPGVDDPRQVKKILGTTARLSFHLVDVSATFNNQPLDSRYKYVASLEAQHNRYAITKQPDIYGRDLAMAKLDFYQNRPVISFRFTPTAAKAFAKLTTDNTGGMIAIVLDNKVISAPQIEVPITDGSGIIQGNFSVAEAEDLAMLLRAGSLPIPFLVVEERVVGPTLGADSIKASIIAGILGYLVVFIFMVVFYKRLGLLSNIALLFNLLLIITLLSVFGVTLTLPGLAGIVLTIGMAIDANILLYERFSAEIAKKIYRSNGQAMNEAFNRVVVTVLDANITTLLTALLLFGLGSGPVRGFAFTLIIGILTSIFSLMFVSRWLINWFFVQYKNTNKMAGL